MVWCRDDLVMRWPEYQLLWYQMTCNLIFSFYQVKIFHRLLANRRVPRGDWWRNVPLKWTPEQPQTCVCKPRTTFERLSYLLRSWWLGGWILVIVFSSYCNEKHSCLCNYIEVFMCVTETAWRYGYSLIGVKGFCQPCACQSHFVDAAIQLVEEEGMLGLDAVLHYILQHPPNLL